MHFIFYTFWNNIGFIYLHQGFQNKLVETSFTLGRWRNTTPFLSLRIIEVVSPEPFHQVFFWNFQFGWIHACKLTKTECPSMKTWCKYHITERWIQLEERSMIGSINFTSAWFADTISQTVLQHQDIIRTWCLNYMINLPFQCRSKKYMS